MKALRFAFLAEPPFCYRATNGDVTGSDVELARHVAQAVGVRLAPVETEFAQLLAGLNDGRWDMTTGLFVTEERLKIAAFSRPIWALPDGLLVRTESRDIHGYAAFASSPALCLGIVRDQVQGLTARRHGARNIRVFENYGAAAAAVASGAIDAFASVANAHRGYLAGLGAHDLRVVEIQAVEKPAEPGAFAFARSRTALRDAVDDALGALLGSAAHRALMARFGFSSGEVDRIATPA